MRHEQIRVGFCYLVIHEGESELAILHEPLGRPDNGGDRRFRGEVVISPYLGWDFGPEREYRSRDVLQPESVERFEEALRRRRETDLQRFRWFLPRQLRSWNDYIVSDE